MTFYCHLDTYTIVQIAAIATRHVVGSVSSDSRASFKQLLEEIIYDVLVFFLDDMSLLLEGICQFLSVIESFF